MRSQRFLRDQFHAYRMAILERRAGAPFAAKPTPAGVEVAIADRHARRDWAVQRGDDGDWPQYEVALQHEHDLVLARREGQVIGWAWLGYDRVYLPPLGREIRLAPGTAYFYDAFVRPAERGHGVGHGLVEARCALADTRGIERSMSHVLIGNEASVHTLRAHGFELVGRTVFLRALALRVWTRAPLPSSTHAA